MRILISGSSGLIGSTLVRVFTQGGHSVIRLVRNREPYDAKELSWYSDRPVVNISQLENFDAVVHLAGANVAARRWTPEYKEVIFRSRVNNTHELAGILARLRKPPKVFVCASAIGIYGNRGDEILTEQSAPGSGFLAQTCVAWEEATQPACKAGIRVVQMRMGMVLSPEGGALERLLPVFRRGMGGRIGSGKQWMSWVSLVDVVRAVSSILQNEKISGPVNVVAPYPVTNAEFTRTLAHAIHRPSIFPMPTFALRAALGGFAEEGLLASTRVLPTKLTWPGFRFIHPKLAGAFEAMFSKSK